jgi:hypothetical protein
MVVNIFNLRLTVTSGMIEPLERIAIECTGLWRHTLRGASDGRDRNREAYEIAKRMECGED